MTATSPDGYAPAGMRQNHHQDLRRQANGPGQVGWFLQARGHRTEPSVWELQGYHHAVAAEDLCEQCRHPFDPHAVIATTGEAMDGGIILCPVSGCECYATWDAGGRPVKRIPDRFEVAAMRERVQRPPQGGHQGDRG